MKLQKLYGITLGLLTFISTGCNDDMENFSNNIFMSSVSPENILVKSNIESDERTFQLEIAKPEESDINFTIKVDPALVSAYKDIYYTNDVESCLKNITLSQIWKEKYLQEVLSPHQSQSTSKKLIN